MKIDSMLGAHADITPVDLPMISEAKLYWLMIREQHGLKNVVPLLTLEGNAKLAKNPVPTYALTLSPAVTAGHNVCERSTPECRKACVMWTAGRGTFPNVRTARQARTKFLADYPLHFLRLLLWDLERAERQAGRSRHDFGVRLNVASDIRWERFPFLFDHVGMTAYDYTKWADYERPIDIQRVNNYRLTYSHNERWPDLRVSSYLDAGLNVAMVFDVPKHQLPNEWNGWPVIDGDIHDYRYADPIGVIVGLAAKGAAKQLDAGGFVQHVQIH